MPALKPLGNTVLLAPIPPRTQSEGGIWYAPGRHRADGMQFVVLEVGPGRRVRRGMVLAPPLRPGQKCLVNPNRVGVKHTFEDGRILIDAECIEMVWG